MQPAMPPMRGSCVRGSGFIPRLTGKSLVSPTLLPTVGRRAPRTNLLQGALRPTVGNSVGETRDFPVCFATRFRVSNTMGSRCRVSNFRCKVSSVEFQVQGFGCQISGAGFRVSNFRCRVSGAPESRSGFPRNNWLLHKSSQSFYCYAHY